MARQKRLNISGAIYHVITRGLNGMKIFRDSKDRKEFLTRLAVVLAESKSQCYAWVLMSNHIHLLIRASEMPLSNVVRRVLSGYAKAFNKKYKRRGYLYQNRFKSILCQEDRYFLELIRYIHLNPVRAGFIKTIEELEKYPYSGHGVIVGRRSIVFQEVGEVLLQFSEKRQEAIQKYRSFIADGWEEGRREDLTGGGLLRSVGGWQSTMELRKLGERWRGDDRILGDGVFVEKMLKKAEENMYRKEKMKHQGWDLDKLAEYICDKMAIKMESLYKRGRLNGVSYARGMLAYWGVEELGFKGIDVARFLGVKRPAINQMMKIGAEYISQTGLKLIN
jgi:REP-associated tyrosine transposase